MAQISLREYLNDISQMIDKERLEQAFAHVRHLMEHYPRNIDAYRLLGRVLVLQRRWQDAEDIFRRLLSVLPNDVTAHVQLSIIYQQLEKNERALWHIERAFDQSPNEESILKHLRVLYQQVRGNKLERVQLTAGAVAAQYLASDLNTQAVDVLRQAIQRMPERTDLRLQLARALWRSGRQLDAAESAIEVLDQLPFALVANRILTQLWLQEDRPFDAQRYLSRIEDVDPYAALQLATGKRVNDNAFMLEPLDYNRYTSHELSTQNPDWLDNIDSEQVDAMDDALLAELDDLDDIPDDFFDSLDVDDMTSEDIDDDDSWLNDVLGADDVAQEFAEAPRKKVTDDLSNVLPDDFILPDDFSDEREDIDFLNEIMPDIDEDAEPTLDTDDTGDLPPELMNRVESLKGASTRETILAKPKKDADTQNSDDNAVHTGLTGMLAQIDADDDDLSWLSDLDEFSDADEYATGQLGGDDVTSAERVPTGFTGALDTYDPDALQTGDLEDVLDSFDPAELERDDGEERVSTGFTGMLDTYDPNSIGAEDFEDVLDSFDPAELAHDDGEKRVSTGFTGMLDTYDPNSVGAEDFEDVLDSFDPAELAHDDGEDIPDWLTGGDSNVTPPIVDADEDAHAWMREAGIELDDEIDQELNRMLGTGFTDDDEPTTLADNEIDPMAWMTDVDVELHESTIAQQLDAQNAKPISQDDEDTLAWMREAGIELDDDIAGMPDDENVPDLFADFDEEAMSGLGAENDDALADDEYVADEYVADEYAADEYVADEYAADEYAADEAGAENDDALADDEYVADEYVDFAPQEAEYDWNDESALDDLLALEDLDEFDDQDGQALMNDERDWQDDELSDENFDETNNDANDDSPEDDPLAWLKDSDEDMSWLNDSGELSDDFLSDESYDSMPIGVGDPSAAVEDHADEDDDTGNEDDDLGFFDDFDDVASDGIDDAFVGFDDEMQELTDPIAEDVPASRGGMLDWIGADDAFNPEDDESNDFGAYSEETSPEAGNNVDWLSDIDDNELESALLDADDDDIDFEDNFDVLFEENELADDGDLLDDPLSAEIDAISEDDLDWMVDAEAPIADTSVDDDDDFADDLDDNFAAASVADDGQPDWLSSFDGGEDSGDEFGSDFEDNLEDDFEDNFEDDFDDNFVAASVADEGQPDWLSSFDGGDGGEDSGDEFGGDFEDDLEDDFADDLDDNFVAASVADEGQPDWLSSFDAVDRNGDAENQPEWLNQTGEFTSAPATSLGDTDTDDEFGDDFDDEFDDNFDDNFVGDEFGDNTFASQFSSEVASEEPDWLSNLEVSDAEADEFDDAFGADDFGDDFGADEFDDAFGADEFDDEVGNFEEAGMGKAIAAQADWLQDFASGADIDEVDAGEQPNWLMEMGSYEGEAGADEDTGFETSLDDFGEEFGEEFSEEDFADEFAEDFDEDFEAASVMDEVALSFYDQDDIDLAPADNAPDWLNAMVPGLDVDYESADDDDGDDYSDIAAASVETPQPTFRRITTEDFDWLNTIVAEEEQADSVMMPPPPPPVPASPVATPLMPDTGESARGRFAFTNPPRWLQKAKDALSAIGDGHHDNNGDHLDDYDELDIALDDDFEDDFADDFDFDDFDDDFDDTRN